MSSTKFEVPFGRGTTPARVAEAVDRAMHRDRDRPAPVSTAKREAFFARIAEDRKRAEAG